METWIKSNLDELILNKVEESVHLEYKSSPSLRNTDKCKTELSKDISAFANSDGGTIIYGIKEYDNQDKKHLPESIDPINRQEISKEWLENVISSNIQPRIQNLFIDPIKTDHEGNKIVYRILIPKSDTAHQANDYRYYRRYNFKSVPMYDYEIKDVLNRAKTPIIDLEFNIDVEEVKIKKPMADMFLHQKSNEPETKQQTYLNIYARNNGKVLAKYVNCFLEIPYNIIHEKSFKKNKFHDIEGTKYVQYSLDNTRRDTLDVSGDPLSGFNRKLGPSRYEPILPSIRLHLRSIRIKNNYKDFDIDEQIILWISYADNSEERKGNKIITEIDIVDKDEI